METIELLQAIIDGKAIRREAWPKHTYVSFDRAKDIFVDEKRDTFSWGDLLLDYPEEFEIFIEPPIQDLSFAQALELLTTGKAEKIVSCQNDNSYVYLYKFRNISHLFMHSFNGEDHAWVPSNKDMLVMRWRVIA